jgi:DNA-binding IclR family transcriptional regulator
MTEPTALPVPAAERTLQLLELLLAMPEGLTAQECLAQLDTSRSSLFDLLRTLKTLGYVEQIRARGRYRPGPRLLAWRAGGSEDPQDLLTAFYQETAHPPLDETLALAIAQPPEVLILAQREGVQRVRSAFEPGERILGTESAAGPVLAESTPEQVSELGYHLSERKHVVEVAVPICADGHRPEAALLVSAPALRHTPESLLRHLPGLREMAARLSYRIGAPVYAPYQGPVRAPIDPATSLSEEDIGAFLQGPWAASLACIRPDGTPHVVPVWHEWDGEAFYVAAWGGARWAEYLRANPQVSLTVDEPWPPLRRVTARGTAHPLGEQALPGGLPAILDRLSRRFLGQALNPSVTTKPWDAFRIQPESLRGWRGLRTGA